MAKISSWNGWGQVADSEKKNVLRKAGDGSAKTPVRLPDLLPDLVARAISQKAPEAPRLYRSRPDAPPPRVPPSPSYPRALGPASLPRIDTAADEKEKWQAVSSTLATQAPSPKPCTLCGQDLGDSQFVLYMPRRSPICRSCRQSARRCPHCLEAHPPGGRGRDEACDDCRGRACTSCGGRIEGSVFRVERHKGLYCEDCFSKGSRCHFCSLPTKRAHPILEAFCCEYCEATAFENLEGALARLDVMQKWVGRLHPLLAQPDVVVLEARASLPGKPPPLIIEADIFHLGPRVPQVWFDRQAIGYLVKPFVAKLSKIKPGSGVEEEVHRLFRMAWFDRDGHWVAAEDEKRRGLRSGNQFTPFYQTWEKVGMAKAVSHLCRLLGGHL